MWLHLPLASFSRWWLQNRHQCPVDRAPHVVVALEVVAAVLCDGERRGNGKRSTLLFGFSSMVKNVCVHGGGRGCWSSDATVPAWFVHTAREHFVHEPMSSISCAWDPMQSWPLIPFPSPSCMMLTFCT